MTAEFSNCIHEFHITILPENFFTKLDDDEDLYNITEAFRHYSTRDRSFKSNPFKIDCIFCKKCGDYRKCTNGTGNVYCKCVDSWGKISREREQMKLANEFRDLRMKRNILLDELEATIPVHDPPPLLPGRFQPLGPSRYWHEGSCLPNSRTCGSGCWKTWCGGCGSGIGGMYGLCRYKRCKEGRKNTNL